MDAVVWLGILILFFAVPVTAETVFSLVFSPDARCGGRAVRVAAWSLLAAEGRPKGPPETLFSGGAGSGSVL